MKGIVESYIAEKKFGFLKGEDKQKYFFHVNNVVKSQKERIAEIKIGSQLDFDPTPAKKGLEARKIKIIESFEAMNIPAFKNYRNHSVKGDIIASESIVTIHSRDRNEIRERLEKLAKKAKANVLYDVDIKQSTASSGNYKYSIFTGSAKMGIVSNKVSVFNESDMLSKQDIVSKKTQDFIDNFKIVKEEEDKAIAAQNAPSIGGFIAFAFIIFIILCIVGA